MIPKEKLSLKKDFTATGFVVNPEKTNVLLIFHKKLGLWLPPGGHINEGEMPHEAVLREVKEETGVSTHF
ncbi:MAG: NUDIX domain-containing protein, partial [Candidatus Micrarchaeota archaeon]